MALCVCKCLNVCLDSDKVEENLDNTKLDLTSTEQRDSFFSEKLISCAISSLKTQVAQPALVGQRAVGRWILHSCLACGQTTHAVPHDRQALVLIPSSLQITEQEMANLKKSSNFSPVFNILVPELTGDIEMKENVDSNNILVSDKRGLMLPGVHQVIGTLSKQLNQTLQSQLEAVEETVRQFRDQKYAEYEAYRERAQRDHKILASIISKARSNVDNEGRIIDESLDNGPPSPQLPPLQRRRLSSIKDAKKIPQNFVKTNRNLPPEEDSLDSEDIFDLEGADSHNNIASDIEDYDSDQGSNDEGIHMAGGGRGAGELARSLPISVPIHHPLRTGPSALDDDDEPRDIAASIKALARSVHGDVFELPRPRFSTQI